VIILGELALWVALPVSIWGLVLAFLGGRRGRGDLVLSGERSVYAVFFLTLLASAGIVTAFLQDRFDYWYVFNYSNRDLDTYFKVSGLWAGQRGSLVFWLLLLSLFSSICVWQNRRKNREFMPYVTGVLLSIITFFVVVLLFADVNPFERLAMVPADGRGLNPQLQNYWMTIHPPTLYLGFTAFTVPFAFAISALLTGRLDSRWISLTRRWTLFSWFLLTNGIIFGMRWAYEELGWGGYWFWDPVENASLLPWLTATAFLHSIIIQENRGMLKVWNMGLVCLTFLLTIFATFLTRSGLIESVHSFAQELRIAYIFLGFMALLIGVSLVLILYRLNRLRSDRPLESFVSREAAFLLNNLIFLGIAFAVLWGTMFPLISEGFFGETIAVGPPFFNRVSVPIGLLLLALTGVGPVIAWRRASPRNLRRNFALPLGVGFFTAALLAVLGMRHGLAILTFSLSAFVVSVIAQEFWKGTTARARIEGEGHVVAFLHLVARNRRRWGGYIVHVGMAMIFSAFAASAFDVDVTQTMSPGETVTVTSAWGHSYELRYEGISASQQPNMLQLVALMSVSREGRPLTTLTAEKRRYRTWDALINEVGIRTTPREDLYIILAEVEDVQGILTNDPAAQRATFEIQVNPLVGWIWYGGLVITLGALIALWPSRGSIRIERERVRRERVQDASAAAAPEPAGVGS
jgi:cytochrome c-type biogenesis protein CcmF